MREIRAGIAATLILIVCTHAWGAEDGGNKPEPKWEKIVIRGETYYRMPEEVAKKLGLPRRDIPDEKNAAILYMQAIEKWRDIPAELWDAAAQQALERPWTAKEFPRLAAWLNQNAPAFALIEKGLALPDHQFPLLMRGPGQTLIAGLTLPHLSRMRGMGRGFVIRGHLREAEKKPREALADHLAAFRLGHHAGQDGTLIGSLVGIALQSMGTRNIGRLLNGTPLQPKDLRALLAALIEARAMLPDPAVAMRGERAMGLNALDHVTGGQPVMYPPGVRHRAARAFMRGRASRVLMPDRTIRRDMAQFYDLLIAAAGKETWEARAAMPDPLRTTKPYNVFGRLLLPALDRALVEFGKGRAVLEGLIQVVALRLYRAERGRYPMQLQDIVPVFLEELPPDPFTGKPFRYLIEGDDFVLYSVGPNATDDNGEDDQRGRGGKDDIAFTSRPMAEMEKKE